MDEPTAGAGRRDGTVPADPDPGPDSDPMPEPPVQPDLDECCGSGCSPCIFDTYAEALERHQKQLKAWRERQGEGGEDACDRRAG